MGWGRGGRVTENPTMRCHLCFVCSVPLIFAKKLYCTININSLVVVSSVNDNCCVESFIQNTKYIIYILYSYISIGINAKLCRHLLFQFRFHLIAISNNFVPHVYL